MLNWTWLSFLRSVMVWKAGLEKTPAHLAPTLMLEMKIISPLIKWSCFGSNPELKLSAIINQFKTGIY